MVKSISIWISICYRLSISDYILLFQNNQSVMTLIFFHSCKPYTTSKHQTRVTWCKKANRNIIISEIVFIYYYNFFLIWMWRDESSTVAPIYFWHTPHVCATSDNRINGFGLSHAVDSLKPFAEILLVMLGIPWWPRYTLCFYIVPSSVNHEGIPGMTCMP